MEYHGVSMGMINPTTSGFRPFRMKSREVDTEKAFGEFLWVDEWEIDPLVICYIAIENGHRNSWFTH